MVKYFLMKLLAEEIKRMQQIMSFINEDKGNISVCCPKCEHSWTIDDSDPDPYLCHVCGYNKLEGKYEPDKLAKWKKESSLKEYDDDYEDYGKRDDLISLKVKLKSMGANDDSRLHITHSDTLNPTTVKQENDRPKPKGLWYSVGFGWLDFTTSDFTGFYDKNKNVSVFEFDVSDVNILHIKTYDEIVAFDEEYCAETSRYRNPDWVRLSEKYDGIEISPYIYKARHDLFWYYGWDVASGCIWNPNGLKVKKLV